MPQPTGPTTSTALPFLDLPHPHVIHRRLVLYHHVGIRPQVVHPHRVFRRAALRGHQHVVVPIHNAHQRRLPYRARPVPPVRDDDDRQPGLAQRGPVRAPAALITSTWSRTHAAGDGMYSAICCSLDLIACGLPVIIRRIAGRLHHRRAITDAPALSPLPGRIL